MKFIMEFKNKNDNNVIDIPERMVSNKLMDELQLTDEEIDICDSHIGSIIQKVALIELEPKKVRQSIWLTSIYNMVDTNKIVISIPGNLNLYVSPVLVHYNNDRCCVMQSLSINAILNKLEEYIINNKLIYSHDNIFILQDYLGM